MNNKGFAITTVLFGLMILFVLLIFSLLGILSICRSNLEKIVDSANGSRDTITIIKNTTYNNYDALKNSNVEKSGLYCFTDTGECKYISRKLLTEE